jgi:hypothetical protein
MSNRNRKRNNRGSKALPRAPQASGATGIESSVAAGQAISPKPLPGSDENLKDLAEHLRLVHFTLIATSVAILAAMLLDPADQLSRAIRELDEIATLRSEWNAMIDAGTAGRDGWVFDRASARVAQEVGTGRAIAGIAGWSPLDDRWYVDAELMMPDGTRPVRVQAELIRWKCCRPDTTAFSRQLEPLSDDERQKQTIGSLSDFEAWWNGLATIHRIDVREPLDSFVVEQVKPAWDSPSSGFHLVADNQRFLGRVTLRPPSSQPSAGTYRVSERTAKEYSVRDLPKQFDALDVFRAYADQYIPADVHDGPAQPTLDHRSIGLATRQQFIAFNPQAELAALGSQHWKPGTFAESFPDLADTTQNIRTLGFTDLSAVLAAEQKRTGEKLEVVGIKLPLEALGRWGILILISIQIYFAMHLYAFLERTRDKATPSVAFVGLYPYRACRIAFYCSSILLPTLAVAVSVRTAGADMRGRGAFAVLAGIELLVAGICVYLIRWQGRALRMQATVTNSQHGD